MNWRASLDTITGYPSVEALIQAAHAATLAPDYIPAPRMLIRCARVLCGKHACDWSADVLVRALGAADGPWKLLGLPKPAAR